MEGGRRPSQSVLATEHAPRDARSRLEQPPTPAIQTPRNNRRPGLTHQRPRYASQVEGQQLITFCKHPRSAVARPDQPVAATRAMEAGSSEAIPGKRDRCSAAGLGIASMPGLLGPSVASPLRAPCGRADCGCRPGNRPPGLRFAQSRSVPDGSVAPGESVRFAASQPTRPGDKVVASRGVDVDRCSPSDYDSAAILAM
jgi:hypothetical protein